MGTASASLATPVVMPTENSTLLARIAPRDAVQSRYSLAVVRAAFARLATTRANARAGLIADSGVSVLLLAAGIWRGELRASVAALTVCAGLLLFSLVEYCFHRWLFHGGAGAMEQGHRKHHEDPAGYDALPFFMPPLAMLGVAAALTILLPTAIALLLTGALAAGYAAYGLSHTAIHSVRFRRRLTRRWAASHHIHHHHPHRNFGVTTPLWDIVLGTRYVSAAARTNEGSGA